MQKKKELELPMGSKLIDEHETESVFGGETDPRKIFEDWLAKLFSKKSNN